MNGIRKAKAKCIVCDKDLESEECGKPSSSIGIVYGATIWRSHGNYGSTVYDPMSGEEFIEACICDECLRRKGDSVRFVQYRRENVINQNTSFSEYERKQAVEMEKWSRKNEADNQAARALVGRMTEKLRKRAARQGVPNPTEAELDTMLSEESRTNEKLSRAMNRMMSQRINGQRLLDKLRSPENRPKDKLMAE